MTRILAAIGLIWSTWLAAAPPMVDGDADGVSDEIDLCLYSRPGDVVNRVGCTLQDDSDADGVPDSVDFCLGTLAERAVDPFGCETGSVRNTSAPLDDGDGDGVSDREDVCPYTDAGARVDPDGCALDQDLDGVADGLDRCPNSPFGQAVNDQGCPAPVAGRVTAPTPSKPLAVARVPVAPPAQLPDPGVDVTQTAAEIASLASPAELAALGRELLRLSGAPLPALLEQQIQAPAPAPPPLPAGVIAQRPAAPASAPLPRAVAVPPAPSPVGPVPAPAPLVSAPVVTPARPAPAPAAVSPPVPAPIFAADRPAAEPTPAPAPISLPPTPIEPAVAPIPAAPVKVVSSRQASVADGRVVDVQFVRGSSELDGRIMSLLREQQLNWSAELQSDARLQLEVIGNQEDPVALASLRSQILRAYLMAMGLPPRRIVVQTGVTGGASTRVRIGASLEAR